MKFIFVAVLAVTCLIAGSRWCSGLQRESEKEVIHLLTLLPYFNPVPANNPSWIGGNDVQPAMDLAMDQINNNSQILENYTLHLIHGDCGCDVLNQAAVGYAQNVFGHQRTVGIVGPGCSSSTIMLSLISQMSELGLVMVHGAGSPTLQNRTEYKYLLGTLGSTMNFIRGYLSLMEKASWNQLAILYDDSRLYYLNTKRLLLQTIPDVNTVRHISVVTQTYIPLNIIRHELLRVIFIMCPLELTQRIICLANNSQMAYKDYQFVIMSHEFHELTELVNFTYDGERYVCSKDDMAGTLEKMFLITYNLQPKCNDTLLNVSNTTYHQYLKYYRIYRESGKYDHLKNNGSRNISYSYWATYFYNAVWAWAFV